MDRILKRNVWLRIFNEYLYDSKLPININYFYSNGSLLGMCLVIQIISGVLLAMFYTPQIDLAFDSVEYIMREVNFGWGIRYIHANTASFFFIIVYLHIGRGIYYGSYIGERSKVWGIGVIIFLIMIITAFMGYVLPMGSMSLWGCTVITNLLTTIPIIGQDLVEYIWGGYSINNATLNRFFAIHYLLPFGIAGLTIGHLIALHEVGSSNPLGISSNRSMINFNPYYTLKDIIGFIIVLIALLFFIFFYPNYLGHPDNYISADPLVTPAHISPEWYLLSMYAILRSIPSKGLGVIGMGVSILILFILTYTHLGIINSSLFRPIYKYLVLILFTDFILLGWIGGLPVEDPYVKIGQYLTILYFMIYLILVPIVSYLELLFTRFKPIH